MNHTPPNPPTGRSTASGAQRRMVPLTVWLCSDTTDTTTQTRTDTDTGESVRMRAGDQAAGLCLRHRQSVGRELARHLIGTCTDVGDLVVEGFTTSEAVLVASAGSDRRGIALVPHFPLARHIGTRLRATLPIEQLARVEMRPARPDQMARGLADHLGDVALVIAAPPPYETGGRAPRRVGERGCPACRADLWMLTGEQLALFLASAWKVLRPGGVLAITTTARHQAGRLIDPAPRIIRQAQGLGFRYVQHVIALRVPIDGDALVVQAGPGDLAELRDIRSRAMPPPVSVHADVCLFTKPTAQPSGGDAR
ncbi:hypothetical protein [Actinomadura bangladeshensis]|uniref:Class I SAM-dependent methyltransferase n=1 Tax=Actinomadura bangladeshensis TaxID=453573 RepID=A0A6L9QUJ2_9ACTN|nr:hypothetical protein [Actinomadura bangladeshensis]NEA28836.1 hypothetical protein [Actinomadura bangladeshensis]